MSEETSTRATWRRLQAYAKPYRWLLVMAALALALEAAASAAVLEVLKYIVDDIFVAKHFSWWLPLGMVALLFLSTALDMLALGERQAQHIGLDVKRPSTQKNCQANSRGTSAFKTEPWARNSARCTVSAAPPSWVLAVPPDT